jgi:hypothetical protein
MSTNDPEFYQAPKFTPEPPPAVPKQRGCFFYGCIIASILALLFVILMGVIGFLGYRFFNQLINDYTSTTPRELPKVEMPAEKRQAVQDRVEAFKKAVDDGTPVETLVLDSDDLNALVEENPDFKGMVFFKIEGDEIKGQVSFPLDKLELGIVQGRYFNGEADFKASLSNGVLIVTLDSFEVNGKRAPDEMMKGIREQNLAKDLYKNPENAERIRKLESLEVKDGKIFIKVRAKADATTAKAQEKTGTPSSAAPAKPEAPPANGEPAKTDGSPKVESPKADSAPPAKTPSPAAEPANPKL